MAKAGQIGRSRFSTIKVGNAITITFLRCLPGFEKGAAKRLCELPEATVYRVFGEADFAVVREFSGPPEPLQPDENAGFSHLRTITAFSWENLSALEVAKLRDYSLVSFCFLKVNPDWLRDHGIRGEHAVLKAIKTHMLEETEVVAAICGTTGWFEAILLICGKTISDILRFANELRRLDLVRASGETKHRTPCFQTTETIPAILISQGLVRRNVQLGQGVKIELRARCYSWADFRVRQLLSELLGAPESIAGTDDLIVRNIRERTLSAYAGVLWKFRAQSRNLLYSTSTSFVLGDEPEEPPQGVLQVDPPTPVSPVSVDVGNRKLRRLSKDNPTLYQALRDTYSLLNDIIFDCRKSAAVADLVPFAQEVLRIYMTSKYRSRTRIRDLNEYLGQCLELLRWGAQQRYLGTDASHSDIATAAKAGGAGGIQRVLASLSLIPTVVMQHLGRKWTGFVTCGWTDDYKRFSEGVLNVGSQSIFQPSTWFVLFHEIGHEYGSQVDISHDPNIRRALMNQGRCTEESLREASEVYAEIFACLFGFGGDFDRCVSHTWKYFKSLDTIPANLSRYFLRFLMVNIFMLEDAGHEYITDDAEIERVAGTLRDHLRNELGSMIDIDGHELESVCSEALSLRAVLDAIRDLMPRNRISRSPQRVDHTPFQDGRILFNIDDPVQFLSSIPSFCPQPTFRQSVAIILSIWNAKMLNKESN